MRYLAICCLLMLAIALAHAIPSQRFRGLMGPLAKAKSKKMFGGQATLINRLRSIKANRRGWQSLQLRQEETVPDCGDICDFESVWLSILFPDGYFQQKFDKSLKCTKEELEGMEDQFAKDYKDATGDELFSKEEVDSMWAARMSDISLEERLKLEEDWAKEAMNKFEAVGVEPTPGLPEKYGCLLGEHHGTLWFNDCANAYGSWECLDFLLSSEEK